jgi:flagellar hook-associated protein 3 FlgL
MYRIKELAVQAANDTVGAQDRQSIALEMGNLREQILSLTNSQDSNGNYLFSGSKAGSPAFSKDAAGRVRYDGDQARMQVNVGDNRRMNLNMPGSDAFTRVVRDDGKGNKTGVDFFQALDDLVKAVKSSDVKAMQRGVAEVDTLQNGISEGLGQIGADLTVVDLQTNVLDQVMLRLKTTRSDVEDLDYTEAITRMNKDQLALEAAQSSFAKISQLSLFKFLN